MNMLRHPIYTPIAEYRGILSYCANEERRSAESLRRHIWRNEQFHRGRNYRATAAAIDMQAFTVRRLMPATFPTASHADARDHVAEPRFAAADRRLISAV